MTTKEVVLKIAEYIATNLYNESRFLTPHPQTLIEVVGLLDEISRLGKEVGEWGQEDVAQVVNAIREQVEASL